MIGLHLIANWRRCHTVKPRFTGANPSCLDKTDDPPRFSLGTFHAAATDFDLKSRDCEFDRQAEPRF
jgi:hypothetical protein